VSTFDPDRLLPDVQEIVCRAGELIQRNYARPKTIRKKAENDLVTETDVAVEEFLKKHLAALLPQSVFLAEESASGQALRDGTWIVDPLDGTTNFAHGLPFVATSVALWDQGEPVLGVVNLPLLGEVFTAVLGGGTCCNGESVHVSDTTELSQSLVATGFPYDIQTFLPEILRNLELFLPRTRGVRRPGAAALDLAYVACGRYDGFWESALHPWDTAAGILLVTEAGGRVSQYSGASYTPGDRGVVASNGHVHREMCALLSGS
jgi:myo-inositol-1(or 4)-monophosphatase